MVAERKFGNLKGGGDKTGEYIDVNRAQGSKDSPGEKATKKHLLGAAIQEDQTLV